MPPKGKALGDFIREAFSILAKYFMARLKISFLLGLICYIVLMILNIRLKGLISLIVGFANLLPYIGPIVSMAITAIIAAFQGPSYALLVVLVNAALQLLDSLVLSPLILGKRLGVPPMVVFAAAIIGSSVFGFWGVVFAVPAAAIIGLIYKKLQ